MNLLSRLVSVKTRTRKRVGRGIGSGKGKTCGSGGKGQTARSGVAIHGFEGGQMPIHRRLPKRGFVSHVEKPLAISLKWVDQMVSRGLLSSKEPVTPQEILRLIQGLKAHQGQDIKLIGKTALSAPLVFHDFKTTQGALVAIESSGGQMFNPSLAS